MFIIFRHGVVALLVCGTLLTGQFAAAQSSASRQRQAAGWMSKLRFSTDQQQRVAAAKALVKMGFFVPEEAACVCAVSLHATVPEVRDGRVVALFFTGRTDLRESDLRDLARFSKLARLEIQCSPKCEAGLVAMPALPALKELTVVRMPLGDRDLQRLGRMSHLTKLDLRNLPGGQSASITSAGLAHLKDMRQLKELTLMHTDIDDAGLGHLSNLAQLKSLCLSFSHVTGHEFPSLRSVQLHGSLATRRGIERLNEAHAGQLNIFSPSAF